MNRILIDTNIILDLILNRLPFSKEATSLFEKIADKRLIGYITSNSVTDIVYISKKSFSSEEIKKVILNLLKLIKIISVDEIDIIEAFNLDFKDFEDALQSQCSKKSKIDFIVTRNEKDFKDSETPAISIGKFLDLLKNA